MNLLYRFYDLLISIYLYNEYIGYRQLDRLIIIVKQQLPDEIELIKSIGKHRSDEFKHYQMFKNYFIKNHRMPFIINQSAGYISQLLKIVFGKKESEFIPSGDLNTDQINQLFRLIILTESRGLKQIQFLLKNRLIKRNTMIQQIFLIIEKDEPDHFKPYQIFLDSQNESKFKVREILSDYLVHYSIILFKFPVLFLNIYNKRSKFFHDDITIEAETA